MKGKRIDIHPACGSSNFSAVVAPVDTNTYVESTKLTHI